MRKKDDFAFALMGSAIATSPWLVVGAAWWFLTPKLATISMDFGEALPLVARALITSHRQVEPYWMIAVVVLGFALATTFLVLAVMKSTWLNALVCVSGVLAILGYLAAMGQPVLALVKAMTSG